ncbi:hypothetical protein AAVH_25930, partial [Aphelenchoides avenae]
MSEGEEKYEGFLTSIQHLETALKLHFETCTSVNRAKDKPLSLWFCKLVDDCLRPFISQTSGMDEVVKRMYFANMEAAGFELMEAEKQEIDTR